jgi:cytochrome b6-f complex iron-sulfur subunit
MSESAGSASPNQSGVPGASRPAPRPPGAVVPRAPRAPDQRGGDLEPERTPTQLRRRTFAWFGLTAFFAALGGCAVKFFFPRTIFEPKATFKIGRMEEFAFGVSDALQDRFKIWVVRDAEKLFVIYARCTHLGCTPNWVSSAGKFKCPCHGSGFDSAGINFEGPAPRPMDRAHVEIAPDGQIVVNVDRLYRVEKFKEPGAFLPV